MSETPLRTVLLDALARVAPEADPSSLDPATPLREQLDLDSMDFLNFVIALHEALGIDVPEADYPRLRSLAEAESYLAERQAP